MRRNQICNYYNCVKMNPSDSLDCLTLHGIKPYYNRMAVLEYLMAHPTHPTVDEIYEGLRGSMPTLSKTTVYNALRLMVEYVPFVSCTQQIVSFATTQTLRIMHTFIAHSVVGFMT